MSVKFNSKYLNGFVGEHEYNAIWKQVEMAHTQIIEKSGEGNDFLGWVDLPFNYDKEEFARIKKSAKKIISDTDVLVVIGIGGSYLGARAAIEAMRSCVYNSICQNTPQIIFVGNSISPNSLQNALKICEGKRVSVNVISKSGTTTECAIAFRVFKKYMEEKYSQEEAKERIYVTTDKSRGTLKELSNKQGYESFVVPDDVGGRYSVLTAVGLLPIAVAGIDIDLLMQGANKARENLTKFSKTNDACLYAATRNILYRKGKSVELLACYEPDFTMMNEWYKQLYGESEGKDQKGILPTSVIFSTDLHSMGQFVQDGARIMFETVVDIKSTNQDYVVLEDENNSDGLNFLAGKKLSEVNSKAMQGTILAHNDGGVPIIVLEVDSLNEEDFGYLIYFFEFACGISGYLLGVNPFDQPGVESYKKNMFALLGKKGYEKEKIELENKLK